MFEDIPKEEVSNNDYVIYILGNDRFRIPIEYLYSVLLRAKGKKIKKTIEANYFSISFTYPDMKPIVRSDPLVSGWDKKITLYVSKQKTMDFDRVKRSLGDSGSVVEGFASSAVVKFENKVGRGKESSGDRDKYIYKDYQIYMSCHPEKNKFNPLYPSCRMVSGYKDMEISASFSADLKFSFIEINSDIQKLLNSFQI